MTKALSPEDIAANVEAIKDPNIADVTFEQGFTRGTQTITQIQLIKPRAAQLRGISLTELLNGDVNTLLKTIPRISNPPMTEQEVGSLEFDDITKLQMAVLGFLASKEQKSQIASMM